MDERYMITVVGVQTVDGEKDRIEVITAGDMQLTESGAVITYPEYAEDNPGVKTDTTVTLENGVLSIDRRGEMSSHLILEEGVRHECLYDTPMGQMFIGIFTDSVKTSLNEHGGELCASYKLDFNRAVVSENEFYISIKEK